MRYRHSSNPRIHPTCFFWAVSNRFINTFRDIPWEVTHAVCNTMAPPGFLAFFPFFFCWGWKGEYKYRTLPLGCASKIGKPFLLISYKSLWVMFSGFYKHTQALAPPTPRYLEVTWLNPSIEELSATRQRWKASRRLLR